MTIQAVMYRKSRGRGYGRKLARALGIPIVLNHAENYGLTSSGQPLIVLTYGRSDIPAWYVRDRHQFINNPAGIQISACKINTLQRLTERNINTLDWTTVPAEARVWMKQGHTVYARTILNGAKGRGIKLLKGDDVVTYAPLYTKGVPIMNEFRVHVGDGEAINVVQKKRKGRKKLDEMGIKEVDMEVRNFAGGWVFAQHDLDLTDDTRKSLIDLGIAAVQAVGLDYGACDVVQHMDGTFSIVEVNSAPGVGGVTNFKAYVNYMERAIESRQ